MVTDWCVLVSLHVIACHNGTSSVGRVVCFVEAYSELVCLHSVKFYVYETCLQTFDVKGKGHAGQSGPNLVHVA